MTSTTYVHGYTPREAQRLLDQAGTLAELFHHDTAYPPGSRVLEAGCGVGAQTVELARRSPGAEITAVDISSASLAAAERRMRDAGLDGVRFRQADLLDLPFPDASFDHVILCFVLEHLPDPDRALRRLVRAVRPGGTVTAIEGDHGSTFFHPDDPFARRTIDALVELQRRGGGHALIGRELYPRFAAAGLSNVCVSPRFVYADASRPAMVEGFTRLTFAAMVEGVTDDALRAGLMSREDWDRGIRALYRCAEPDAVFCYTFFKAAGTR
jgi:SAM-dependent methyltransferase